MTDLTSFTLRVEEGFIVYDCGFITPITHMWDRDGEYTDDWREATAAAWKPPGDRPYGYLCLIEFDDDDDADLTDLEVMH